MAVTYSSQAVDMLFAECTSCNKSTGCQHDMPWKGSTQHSKSIG